MADVFISYSSYDGEVAGAVCQTLESRGIRCWIAPRDVIPGVPYAEALIDGLNQCRLMVLIFSANSNQSPQVIREVERAVNKGITILPFRIDNVALSKSMEYFVSSSHWLDALTPPIGRHLPKLADTVQVLLYGGGNTALMPAEMQPSYMVAGNPVQMTTAVQPVYTTVVDVKPRNKAVVPVVIISCIIVVALAIVGVLFLMGWFRPPVIPAGMPPSSPPESGQMQQGSSQPVPPQNVSVSSSVQDSGTFKDDFTDLTSGWKQVSTERFECNYINGEFSLTEKRRNWGDMVVNRNAARFSDMVIEVDARHSSGSINTRYGLVFRAQDVDNYYRFLVTGKGEYLLQRVNGMFSQQLVQLTRSEFISSTNVVNHLKVICKGPQISLECNGHPLTAVTDKSLAAGWIGLGIYAVEPPGTAVFDNLKVYSVK
ncbi:MAG: TIR domain-containing protein [Dehalococcoidia bacterium]|nr:MAG: TIR domain-containing protein [Dehalococcoidia bacterium]